MPAPECQRKPPKHIPQRTCVACRTTRPKSNLIRLVCTSSGAVRPDRSAKEAGRGAYLCPLPSCWETGLKRNRLEKALKAKLSPEDQAQLAEFGKSHALLAHNGMR